MTVRDEPTARLDPTTAPDLAGALVRMWFWPVYATGFWTSFWCHGFAVGFPETDRGDTHGQIPVPDPIQSSMDSDLFA